MAIKKTTRKAPKAKLKKAALGRKATSKKTTAKRAPARKAAIRKTATKKVVASRPIKTIKEPLTKTQVFTLIAEKTDLSRKQVKDVFDVLGDVIHAHCKRGAAGLFNLIGLIKLQVVRKPATKARKGINPFTGEETMFKAKPARNVVKARALKRLKDMAV